GGDVDRRLSAGREGGRPHRPQAGRHRHVPLFLAVSRRRHRRADVQNDDGRVRRRRPARDRRAGPEGADRRPGPAGASRSYRGALLPRAQRRHHAGRLRRRPAVGANAVAAVRFCDDRRPVRDADLRAYRRRRRTLMLLALLLATWTDVATALGRSGTEMPGGVYKVSFPRSDLDVVAGGVHVKPALALGSWAAFIRTEHGAMAMGDLVLTENEVNDVISALQAGGIEQSALHNHLIGESPRVMYLHFDGHGDEVKL